MHEIRTGRIRNLLKAHYINPITNLKKTSRYKRGKNIRFLAMRLYQIGLNLVDSHST